MRLKILAALILSVIGAYSIFWFVLAGNMQDRLDIWIEGQAAKGVEIKYSALELYGFPYRMELAVRDLEMKIPAGRQNPEPYWIEAEEVIAVAFPWKLDHLVLTSASFTMIRGRHDRPLMEAAFLKARSSVNLASDNPAADLGILQRLSVVADQARFRGEDKRTGRAHKGEWHADIVKFHYLKPDETAGTTDLDLPAWGHFYLEAQKLTMPDSAKIFLGENLENLRLEMILHAQQLPDYTVDGLSSWRDQGGTISFRKIDLKGPEIGLKAAGDLALDMQLKPLGAFSAQFGKLGPLLKTTGLADNQEYSLSFQNGRVFVGPLPVFGLEAVVE